MTFPEAALRACPGLLMTFPEAALCACPYMDTSRYASHLCIL
ncbi:hypothetical protein HMPREF1569_2427, partial [Klebsiella oxytoca OK-1]